MIRFCIGIFTLSVVFSMVCELAAQEQQAKQAVAVYRTSSTRQPADLFDIYIDLRSLLEDITILSVEDEFNGNRNRAALTAGYDSFIKLTGVWFTGEMKEAMRNLAR